MQKSKAGKQFCIDNSGEKNKLLTEVNFNISSFIFIILKSYSFIFQVHRSSWFAAASDCGTPWTFLLIFFTVNYCLYIHRVDLPSLSFSVLQLRL